MGPHVVADDINPRFPPYPESPRLKPLPAPEEILALLRRRPAEGWPLKELLHQFGLGTEGHRALKNLLRDMMREEQVEFTRSRRYRPALRKDELTGSIRVSRKTGAVFLPDNGSEPIELPEHLLSQVRDGDQAAVKLTRGRPRKGKPVTRGISSLRVTARKAVRLVGEYREMGPRRVVVADAPGGARYFNLIGPPEGIPPPRNGDLVQVEIEAPNLPEHSALWIRGFGPAGEYSPESERILAELQAAVEFPAPAAEYAAQLTDGVTASEIARRRDLRDMPLVTVDGETARDFDDAIVCFPEGEHFRLIAAIADVAHYVKDGDPVDREAYDRATSIYLPDRAIPMLPERLSNHLCSLRPGEDKVVMAVEILVDIHGRPQEEQVYEAVMRSHARITYRELAEFYDHGRGSWPPAVQRSLRALGRLTEALRSAREARGSIDLNIPETEVVMENGVVKDIRRADRFVSHRVVEECMLAANEAVARICEREGIAPIYRVHAPPRPEKLEKLGLMLERFGPGLTGMDPEDLQAVIDKVRGQHHEQTVQLLVLRSMMQAVYSAENSGHFGLASEQYLHFTSPIRRYPDLLTHRVVKRWLHRKEKGRADHIRSPEELDALALHCTERERRAMEIERGVKDLCRALLFRDRTGDTFDARIMSVASFGLFVDIAAPWVSGLIPIASLGAEFYEYDEQKQELRGQRSGHVFCIGDQVRVICVSVSVERRQIVFNLADAVDRKYNRLARTQRGETGPEARRGTRSSSPPPGRRPMGGTKRR
ncbi:MAG: Ribonuclease R [Myxococcota bacterium]|nr:Ribonuclease R [Myxococcota bacterium]